MKRFELPEHVTRNRVPVLRIVCDFEVIGHDARIIRELPDPTRTRGGEHGTRERVEGE